MKATQRKLQRFFHPHSGRAVFACLDQAEGVGGAGARRAAPEAFDAAREAPVQAVALPKGAALARGYLLPARTMLIVQLSAGTRHGLPTYNRALVCSVSEALRLGADAVALQLNIGNELEDRMLSDCGAITDEARQFGTPVIASLFARGGQIVNEYDPSLIAHCIQLGGELGADLVCVPYSGDPVGFARAVGACEAPVMAIDAPGSADFSATLDVAEAAFGCGAVGFCVGRSLFMSDDPGRNLAALSRLAHGDDA